MKEQASEHSNPQHPEHWYWRLFREFLSDDPALGGAYSQS